MITMKFGGTSVGSIEAIEHVVSIIQEQLVQDPQVVVVVSAMSGVTDLLLQSIERALLSDKWGYISISNTIRDRHEDAINQLIRAGDLRQSILGRVNAVIDQHIQLCEAINVLGEATPRIRDTVVSFGERLSSRMIAAVLQEHGINAQAFDAGQFLVTNNIFQDADPLWDVTQANIQQELKPIVESGVVPIITGFTGKTLAGDITTLGRGGSDFSAAVFAAYLDSRELIIWTDVDGVMTTDPRLDPRARVLPYVSYTEVGELAYYGAKVLHPKTVQPIIAKEIPLRVRNTFNPSHTGTLIGAQSRASNGIIKAVTAIREVSMLTVSGKGMLGVPGIAGRTFLATAQAGASILMISQSSSEQSFCFTVIDSQSDDVKASVENELASEIAHRDVDGIDVLANVVIITVIGAGMRHKPGVAGSVFTRMGEHGVNVLSIAQGSSECSISFVIDEQDLELAVLRLHDLALESNTLENNAV
ncbi:MAG: aspartate kinase [Anaerolineae bacterium]